MSSDGKIPFTRRIVSPEKSPYIRAAVKNAASISTENDVSRVAKPDDAALFLDFLSDPAVHAPIYTLPLKLTQDTVRHFIAKHCEEQRLGTGLLFLNFNTNGYLGEYQDICVWPEWAAGELGGAVHPMRQGKGKGFKGAELAFDWMFETLALDVICETASLENTRTARLLDALKFRRVGQVISKRENGSPRPSNVWEMKRAEWQAIYKDT